MELKEREWEGVFWIHLAKVWDKWLAVSRVMDFLIS
jgi:hypothetical protein